ncbi:MAG: hypothetical protein JRI98_05470 [Deltaproteobacteria bacterium]|nr:hypothetical protein [Deltaproteobacteria bacterium]
MMNASSLQLINKHQLVRDFSSLVDKDRRDTATMLVYVAEIDRRKLYLEHACPSMFAFCTKRFHMSEAVAARRIRAGRATCRFPCIFDMIARGELHLSGVHQLAGHLTEDNHQEVLQRAKHRSMREIEKLIAEISPKPDVPASVRALPIRRVQSTPKMLEDIPAAHPIAGQRPAIERLGVSSAPSQGSKLAAGGSKPKSRVTPLSPRRYKIQVTIGQEGRDKLSELQDLLSHQIPDGDLAAILDRALDALLVETRKKKASFTENPRSVRKRSNRKGRAIPAQIRREVFERDQGRCVFVDACGRRCLSGWQVEFHHVVPYARGGSHGASNRARVRGEVHGVATELSVGASLREGSRRL